MTGGASGIGAATCAELAARGASVAVLDRDAGVSETLGVGGTFIAQDVVPERSSNTGSYALFMSMSD